ncbi:MAG: hypothetical protein KF730_01440 [Sphingomonas sp.]|uniref:hypothetical protein n=1 Tax=Sphingomonas sp. TaxID=28214 RepID=UPI0025FF2B95|nr:hypothetical protein [Sphingomonas sp.]MBX3563216.1 hypothetical protein [Sphingomonas sp.]
MQPPVQTIRIDRAHKLVEVHLSGFFTAEDAAWTGEELRAAILSLGLAPGEHVTLYDATELNVAPNATVEAVKSMFANPSVRPLWARKVAIITRSALARLQIRRLREARADIAIFAERDAAVDWLLAA